MNDGEYEDEDDNWFAEGMVKLGKGLLVVGVVGALAFTQYLM